MDSEHALQPCSRADCDNPGDVDHGTFLLCRFHNAESKKAAQKGSVYDEGYERGWGRGVATERERVKSIVVRMVGDPDNPPKELDVFATEWANGVRSLWRNIND